MDPVRTRVLLCLFRLFLRFLSLFHAPFLSQRSLSHAWASKTTYIPSGSAVETLRHIVIALAVTAKEENLVLDVFTRLTVALLVQMANPLAKPLPL